MLSMLRHKTYLEDLEAYAFIVCNTHWRTLALVAVQVSAAAER